MNVACRAIHSSYCITVSRLRRRSCLTSFRPVSASRRSLALGCKGVAVRGVNFGYAVTLQTKGPSAYSPTPQKRKLLTSYVKKHTQLSGMLHFLRFYVWLVLESLVQTFLKPKKTGPGLKKTKTGVFFSLWTSLGLNRVLAGSDWFFNYINHKN